MAASPSSSSPAAAAPVVTFEDLDNSVRNGKKKLYWSAFEVVLVTAQGGGGAPVETRYDAYQVNHNHLKKLHAGARGPHYVRVECKYCTAPRFTQSITVSTKKFEEHYMTLHALDALATADAKKAAQQLQQHQQQRKSGRVATAAATATARGDGDGDDAMDGEGEEDDEAAEEGGLRQRPKRARKETGASTPVAGAVKRTRRGALTKDDDDHVAAMQGAAAAVVALSGGASATPRAVDSDGSSSAPSAHTVTKPAPTQQQQVTTLPSSLVDSSVVLDPADSDTKRAKKSYWTAYEVVICERVPRAGDIDGEAATAAGAVEMVTRETRQDAWRVNHNALRRLHLDPQSDTTVRVECRFCDEPKFNQSITVSTRKFEQHYYYEHGDESQRQELEERLAAKAAAEAAALTDAANGTSQDASMFVPRRRKSWKALLMDRENAAAATYAAGGSTGKLPFGGVGGPHTRGVISARHQRASLMNWLLHDYLPLSTVGCDHFQAFVGALDRKFELPQPTALRSELQQRFDLACRAAKRQIEEELAAGTAFALAVDQFPVRTSAGDEVAHVSVTVHFISRDWERSQLVLACRAVGVAPPLKAVWAVVRLVLDEFGIPATAIASVTASSVDDLSLAVEGVASLGESRERRAPAKILCAAGALHEIVEAGIRVLRRDVVEFEPIHSLLELEALEASTWTDMYASVSTIVSQHKTSATDGEKSQPAASLSPEAILTAQAVAELLDPFMRIAEDMSRAEYPTIPMIFQYFRHMKEILAQHETRNDPLVPVIKAMQTALGDLYDKVIHSKALIAYVLDPRFHFSHISSVDETSIRSRIVEAIAAIKGESEAAVNNGVTEGRAEQQGEDSTAASTTRQTRSLFEELATNGKRTSIGGASSAKPDGSGATTSSQAELDEYLGLDDEDFSVNVLQWWQAHEAQFPTLAQLARRYLSVVGTSLPAAELFTRDGQQLAARRSALSPSTVEATVVVRAMADPIEHTQPQPTSTRARAAPLTTEPRRRASAANTPSPTTAVAVPPALEATPPAASEQATSDKDALAVIV